MSARARPLPQSFSTRVDLSSDAEVILLLDLVRLALEPRDRKPVLPGHPGLRRRSVTCGAIWRKAAIVLQ
jgi:hypothetical protein